MFQFALDLYSGPPRAYSNNINSAVTPSAQARKVTRCRTRVYESTLSNLGAACSPQRPTVKQPCGVHGPAPAFFGFVSVASSPFRDRRDHQCPVPHTPFMTCLIPQNGGA